jgi:DnaK suppressor protein
MTNDEKKEIKLKIEEDIDILQKQIAILEENSRPIPSCCPSEQLTRTEEMGDQEINNKILQTSRLHLIQLQNALLRVETPLFGICVECEEEIALERMRIRPESTRCVACKM